MTKTEAIKELVKLMADYDITFQDIIDRYNSFQVIEPKFERKQID